MDTPTQSLDRLIRLPEVEHLTGFKRSHIYALMAGGEFPRQIKLGRRASAWKESSVRSWVNARIAEAEAA